MFGKTSVRASTTSEFGELGGRPVELKRDTSDRDRTLLSRSRDKEDDGEYDSFLDVGVERNKGRSRKETLKAKPVKTSNKKFRGDKEVLSELPSAETPPRGTAGRLRKKASKIFKIDKPKTTPIESERPDIVALESSSSIPQAVSRIPSRSTSASLVRQDSSTTTSDGFSITSGNGQPFGSSSQISQLSISPPSRRSSRSSARSLFKSRRSSASKPDHQSQPVPSVYKRQGSSNLPLGQPLSVSSSLPLNTIPFNDVARNQEQGEESPLGQFTEIPEVITTSATPAQKKAGYDLPSAEQSGISGRMSSWFANIIPNTAMTTSVTVAPGMGSRGNLFGVPGEGRSSTRPDSIVSANSGPLPSSVSAPSRASFSSMPGDATSGINASTTASPSRKTNSTTTFLQVARQKAAGMGRWVLDNEALPDGTDPIWILGIEHRFDVSSEDRSGEVDASNSEEGSWGRQHSNTTTSNGSPKSKRLGIKRSGSPSPSSPSTNSSSYFGNKAGLNVGNLNIGSSPNKKSKSPTVIEGDNPGSSPNRGIRSLFPLNKDREKLSSSTASWPESCKHYYTTWTTRRMLTSSGLESVLQDFRSIVWCTYRSQYAPILSLPAELYLPSAKAYLEDQLPSQSNVPYETLVPSSQTGGNNGRSSWSWVSSVGANMGLSSAGTTERGLTTDGGWGCMLRTGQCLLANSLIRRHLGRSEYTLDKQSEESR
jgi:hypothetical protein